MLSIRGTEHKDSWVHIHWAVLTLEVAKMWSDSHLWLGSFLKNLNIRCGLRSNGEVASKMLCGKQQLQKLHKRCCKFLFMMVFIGTSTELETFLHHQCLRVTGVLPLNLYTSPEWGREDWLAFTCRRFQLWGFQGFQLSATATLCWSQLPRLSPWWLSSDVWAPGLPPGENSVPM